MAEPFFDRLRLYYDRIGRVFRDEGDAAAIFPNTTDKGLTKENAYVRFLQTHLPAACCVSLGGFLFNQEGEESDQLDIMVTSNLCPRYNLFQNALGSHKSFACVDGALAVFSIKSKLDQKEMKSCLANFKSIPQHRHTYDWDALGIEDPLYIQWPYKVVFAYDGIAFDTLRQCMERYGPIQRNRQPDMIHVAGKYRMVKLLREEHRPDGRIIPAGHYVKVETDEAALAVVIDYIQKRLMASTRIPYDFTDILHGMYGEHRANKEKQAAPKVPKRRQRQKRPKRN